MPKFGTIGRNGKEWRTMFDAATGVETGMEVDEALGIVLELARDADGPYAYNENAEALGIVERLRFFIEKEEG
jgi:hypothetical protein